MKDNIDFQQIPWWNGRFDPNTLEEKVENSARMERLWRAWEEEAGSRTLVFCWSRRHPLYSRDWLRRRGVRAAAVFSGDGGDPRGASLADFAEGKLDALCAVDLFNEGLDIPKVDRVVMLRPTESKIIFIQQLGRGLRSAEGKLRLTVIDSVGNQRIFASRLIHLLSLGARISTWADKDAWLKGEPPHLPPGCLIDIELEARDLLRQLLPTGGTAAVEAYRALRDDLQRRPTMTQLFHRGYLPSTIRARHGIWLGFVVAEGDLSASEREVADAFRDWLAMLEVTALNKSYKMVVLRVLLDNDAFWSGMPIERLAATCRELLLSHPVLRHDLPPTKQSCRCGGGFRRRHRPPSSRMLEDYLEPNPRHTGVRTKPPPHQFTEPIRVRPLRSGNVARDSNASKYPDGSVREPGFNWTNRTSWHFLDGRQYHNWAATGMRHFGYKTLWWEPGGCLRNRHQEPSGIFGSVDRPRTLMTNIPGPSLNLGASVQPASSGSVSGPSRRSSTT